MLLHPKPKDVLVIGLGTGLASRRFLHYDIDRLDCVEIESELPDLLREHFDSAWMEDDKVRILVEDGRSHLSHTDQEYDVISIAVGQTYRPGVASFYTEEFYERAKQALRSGGCVSQFIPTQMLTTAELQSLIATFLRTFPQSMLWYNTEEMLLVGRDVPKLSFDTDRLRLLLPGTPVHKDLEFRYWGGIANYINRSETLLAGFLVGPKGLAALVGDAPTYTDDRPWIEYSTAESRDLVDEQGTTIKLITRHLGDVSDVLGDKPADASLRFTEALRARHLSDLRAVILTRVARSGRAKNLDEAEAMLRKAIELSPENVKIRHSYAYLLFDLKRVDEALELLTETLNIDPTNAVSYNVMGNALILAGKPEDAIHEFERAIRIDGKNDVPHLNLGQILAKQGQFAKATPHLRICVEQDPENPIAREWLGRALDAQGKTIEAVEQLSHAMRLRPGAPAIAQILVWILATHEDPALPTAEETVAMAEHMAEATRDQSPAILDILAASYARAGRFPEAVQSATQAIDLAKQQKNAELATEIEARRKLYEGKKPYLK
jgi:spermidine synthase